MAAQAAAMAQREVDAELPQEREKNVQLMEAKVVPDQHHAEQAEINLTCHGVEDLGLFHQHLPASSAYEASSCFLLAASSSRCSALSVTENALNAEAAHALSQMPRDGKG